MIMTAKPSWRGAIPLGLMSCLFLFTVGAGISSQNPLPTGAEMDSPTESLTEDSGEELFTPSLVYRVDPLVGADEAIEITLLRGDGSVETLALPDYLWGVVAAEMPASFPLESLKAQAVAARSYTALRLNQSKHGQADLCDDSACCQAYLDLEVRLASWGTDAPFYQETLRSAIEETNGLYVLYQGAPIDAVFFSSSGGQTLSAQEVWGSDSPYLQSVSSPEGAEVPSYHSEVFYSETELRALLLATYPQMDLSAPLAEWFGAVVADSIGGVAQMTLGGVTLTGAQIRSALGLRSTYFTLSLEEEGVLFSVTGYGHNVGMSQYGAKTMAEEGQAFHQILQWYYQNTTVGGYSVGAYSGEG